MNYEFWIEAEKFLYDKLFIYIVIMGALLILVLNMLSYIRGRNKRNLRILFSIMVISLIGLGISTVINYNKYMVLYDYNVYVNPGIRNVDKGLLSYRMASHAERTSYNQLYLLNNFRKTSIYEEERVIQEVEFLGRDGDYFYFQDRDGISYRELGDYLEISDEVKKPIREGARFHIKDPRFLDIGFKEKSSDCYLLGYKIPKSMENKKFEAPENTEIKMQGKYTLGWMNPTFSNIPSSARKEMKDTNKK